MIWRINQREVTLGEAEAYECCTSYGQTRCTGDTREICGGAENCEYECGGEGCWVSHDDQQWCDSDGTEHTCVNGSSESNGTCCAECGDGECSECEQESCAADCGGEPPPSGDGAACDACTPGSDCNWCSEARNNCLCSDLNGSESDCWIHAGSGCAWISGACTCNSSGTTNCSLTGNVRNFTCTSGPCVVSVAQCYDQEPSQTACDAHASDGVGCGSQTVTLSAGQSYSLNPPGSCGIYQLDAHGCGWSDSETGCEWSTECDESPPPPPPSAGCGNGTLDSGESCDPPDSTSQCPGGGICSASCTCPGVTSQYLTVSGSVYCQDPNSERYPVTGANIQFIKASSSESLTTGADGAFSSQANTTTSSQGPFGVSYMGLSNTSQTLSTGVAYSDMIGPVLDTPSVCTTGRCSSCTGNYASCSSLVNGSNAGFNWKFTGCSVEEVNPDWSLEKTATVVCFLPNTVNAYAEASYVITLTNESDVPETEATVTSLVDELDPTISDVWVMNITPDTGVVSDGTVTWSDITLASGESMTFTYEVRLPNNLFGEMLDNHVVATPEEGNAFHAYASAIVGCNEYTPEQPLPSTGLFDSTVARIGLGILLVVMGYVYYKFGLFDSMMQWMSTKPGVVAGKVKYAVSLGAQRNRWEKRMLKKVERNRRKGRR
jgi:hypothetical protein